ncbi:MAG: NFACT family protein [Thermomicrobium sp.]|nr:NFACT family protein [Thermomicrobium sp.]
MFDVLTIAALTDECRRTFSGGRVQKVVQTEPLAVALEIYAGQRWGLVIDVSPQQPKLFLSRSLPAGDPDQVTPFLLLLRKYVRGARLVGVEQVPLERIVRFRFASRLVDERREEHRLVETELIVELMGRHSNAILVAADGRILDALKRVPPTMSAVRPVLPGRPYQPPPPQLKRDPRQLTPRSIASLLLEVRPDSELAAVLVQHLAGFSPQMAREALFRAAGTAGITVAEARGSQDFPERLAAAIAGVLAPLETGAFEPTVYRSDGVPVAFAAIRLHYLQGFEVERFATISEAIERFSTDRPEPIEPTADRYAHRRQRLLEAIARERARVEARLHALEQEAQRAREAERWRRMGEAILTAIGEIEPGQRELVFEELRIPLDPERTPVENAQEYFERYRKAKAALEHVPARAEATRLELEYLQQLEALTAVADSAETLEALRQELGLLEGSGGATAPRQRAGQRKLRAWRTERGDRIVVGRNARENDWVTFSVAKPDDVWLHARGLAGAHVILQWAGPEDPRILEKAASIAAWYSEGRESTRVAVDVTRRRDVRRIPSAAPGLVRYRNERTLHVRPLPPDELGLVEA